MEHQAPDVVRESELYSPPNSLQTCSKASEQLRETRVNRDEKRRAEQTARQPFPDRERLGVLRGLLLPAAHLLNRRRATRRQPLHAIDDQPPVLCALDLAFGVQFIGTQGGMDRGMGAVLADALVSACPKLPIG